MVPSSVGGVDIRGITKLGTRSNGTARLTPASAPRIQRPTPTNRRIPQEPVSMHSLRIICVLCSRFKSTIDEDARFVEYFLLTDSRVAISFVWWNVFAIKERPR